MKVSFNKVDLGLLFFDTVLLLKFLLCKAQKKSRKSRCRLRSFIRKKLRTLIAAQHFLKKKLRSFNVAQKDFVN